METGFDNDGKVMWRRLIDGLSAERRADLLKRVLRTRRPWLSFHLNGCTQSVRRAEVRDYLNPQGAPSLEVQ